MNQMGGGMPGTMGNVANQAMQQQQQGGGGGGKSDTLRLRLDLNLDIEITLKAKIHGDLELALLYVLTFTYLSYPLLLSCHPVVWCYAWGEGLRTAKWTSAAHCFQKNPPCFSRLVILPATGRLATHNTVQPRTSSLPPSPPHCNHICSVSKGRPGIQRKKDRRSTVYGS